MCGIFGYVGPRKNAPSIVLGGLKGLEYRGYDSWGIAVAAAPNQKSKIKSQKYEGKIIIKKRAGKIGQATVSDLPSSSFALGHTRWATHGGVTNANAHPHLDCTGKIAIIHNGIIENYEELKTEHLRTGHKFISETDSEVFAHLVEKFYRGGNLVTAVRKSFNLLAGLNAIVAVCADKNEFVAVRKGSPLVVGFGRGENFLSSDPAALLPHTRRVYFLEDDQMAKVTAGKVEVANVRTGRKIIPKIQTLNWSERQTEKGRYPYFMLKEIYEQPKIVAEIGRSGGPSAKAMAKLVKKSHGSYLVACGTAAFAALAGSYIFSKVAKRHINAAIGSEFGYQLDFLTDRSLVIALSQSGETMDTLEAVKAAKAKGAKILALVNVLGSSLYRMADYKVLIGAGPEKAVASTKAFVGKIAHLILLAYTMAGKVGDGQKIIEMAGESAEKVLAPGMITQIRKLAKKLKAADDIYVVGRGLSYPASLETALKIKEVSYIHAEGLAAGELKHGPLALVTKGTPCIVFVPDDEAYGANLAGAVEMRARGGYIIGVSCRPHEVFDEYIPVADAGVGTIIPNVIFGQLLAYYLAVARKLDPDMPRNLAKSVTVK